MSRPASTASQATGNGLVASLNTSTLNLSFSVNSAAQSGDTFNFAITGGGANFQFGPDVVSNEQARLGIPSVSTTTLGGVAGTLYELRSGGDKSLADDTVGAAAVVSEAITRWPVCEVSWVRSKRPPCKPTSTP